MLVADHRLALGDDAVQPHVMGFRGDRVEELEGEGEPQAAARLGSEQPVVNTRAVPDAAPLPVKSPAGHDDQVGPLRRDRRVRWRLRDRAGPLDQRLRLRPREKPVTALRRRGQPQGPLLPTAVLDEPFRGHLVRSGEVYRHARGLLVHAQAHDALLDLQAPALKVGPGMLAQPVPHQSPASVLLLDRGGHGRGLFLNASHWAMRWRMVASYPWSEGS